MGLLADVPEVWRRRYRILIGIIVLAGLCYCVAFTALALAPSNRIALVTATATRTPIPTASGVTLLPGVTPSPSPTQFIPPTFTPSSTSSPTPTPSATATPTFTPTSTDTPSPSPTSTPTNTSAPTSSPTATATSGPLTYDLLIAKRGDDSLFVVNQTSVAFPLEPLRLGDGNAAINGLDWGIDTLEQGDCVTAWQDTGSPQPPRGLTCNQVGLRLTRDGPNRFWRSGFNVYYRGELIVTCAKRECAISIPIE